MEVLSSFPEQPKPAQPAIQVSNSVAEALRSNPWPVPASETLGSVIIRRGEWNDLTATDPGEGDAA